MRRLAVIGLALLCLGLLSQPAARADSSLASVLFNVNGATQTGYAGFNTGSWNSTTGIGTLTYVFNPGAGTYNFTAFFDNQVANPFFNEFGSTTGAPAAGQSWEIGDSFGSTIYGDTIAGTLNNSNMLPGQTGNFLQDCTAGASCNGDAALAMGFHFVLGAGQEAVITLTFSTSAPPGGFFLTQTHPIDAGNNSSSSIYFSGNEAARQIVVGAPEPGSLLLVSLALAGLCLIKGRKFVSAAI
jgi:hypothetical protein